MYQNEIELISCQWAAIH